MRPPYPQLQGQGVDHDAKMSPATLKNSMRRAIVFKSGLKNQFRHGLKSVMAQCAAMNREQRKKCAGTMSRANKRFLLWPRLSSQAQKLA